MSEKDLIRQLTAIGYNKEEAEELYDFYMSIDCEQTLITFAMLEIMLTV